MPRPVKSGSIADAVAEKIRLLDLEYQKVIHHVKALRRTRREAKRQERALRRMGL